jgi:HEAT repeat protein
MGKSSEIKFTLGVIALWALMALWLLRGTLCLAQEAAGPPRELNIKIHDGLMTVSIKDASLIQVLQEIQEQSGIEFEIGAESDRKISAEFSDVPMEEGLKRLLNPVSHSIVYNSVKDTPQKTEIKKVVICDQSKGSIPQQRGGVSRSLVPGKRPAGPAAVPARKPVAADTDKSLGAYGRQLDDADPDVRESAISDMADEYKEASLIYLEKSLVQDGNRDVRMSAAEAIGDLESKAGIGSLTKGLNDPDEEVREAVVDALGTIGGKDALPALKKALQDSNENVRETAADLIQGIEEAAE